MFVTNSLSGGGAERAMNLICNELHLRNWKVALIPINSSPPDFIEPICEVFPLARKWRGGLVGTVYAFIKFNIFVKSWNPDVVVVTCDLPEFFGALLLSKKRFVLVEESSYPWSKRKFFGRLIRKLLEFRGVKTVAASSHLKIWPHRYQADAVIQNAITPFKTKQVRTKKERQLVRLNFIGRFSKEKRPDLFLKVCNVTGFKGRLIGDGDMKETLQDLVSNKSIDVEFAGFLKDPWVALSNGDLLIVPSMFEGDGLVVIEAMMHGVPLLISDIPDFRRFALPEVHYCHDADDFARQIVKYSNRLEDLVIPQYISSKILLSRSISAVGDKWEEFLDTI